MLPRIVTRTYLPHGLRMHKNLLILNLLYTYHCVNECSKNKIQLFVHFAKQFFGFLTQSWLILHSHQKVKSG